MSALLPLLLAVVVGCGLLIVHTYVLFPMLLLHGLRHWPRPAPLVWDGTTPPAELPTVAVLVAAYNEQKVVEEKIRRTFASTYPKEKITLYLGSDASTDQTDAIIQRLQAEFGPDRVVFRRFPGRTGKIRIINALAENVAADVLVMTDANVFFSPEALFQMVKYLRDPRVGLIGGNILNEEVRREGISVQERAYLLRENQIKHQEGRLWGAMMGAFGGCYTMRRTVFRPVPETFLNDDFWQSVQVVAQGFRTLTALEALVYEDVSNVLFEEFRRKVRIGTGNFQNLHYFRRLLCPWGREQAVGIAFGFWSHKVFRWLTPHLLLLALVATAGGVALTTGTAAGIWWQAALAAQLAGPLLTGVDRLLRRAGWNLRLLRFNTHFYAMNYAMLLGWWRYVKAPVETSVWTPTERFQW